MSRLDAYLARIGYVGPVRVDRETLFALHRAHLLAIPYENLDIHLGRRLTLDVDAIFDKLVTRRRGGWCYEMNGLFAWALREIGFDVTLLAGTVGRAQHGAAAEGNHLLMRIALERDYVADVGFGNGFIEPLPLVEGDVTQLGFLKFGLRRDRELWVVTNDGTGGPGFDFPLTAARLDQFAAQCHALQTDPASGFVRITVCHRLASDAIYSLRGAVLQTLRMDGLSALTLETLPDYRRALEDVFDLRLPEVDTLWAKVWAAHRAWQDSQPKS